MTYRTTIQPLDGGRVLAECGPMRLVIGAGVGRLPQREPCVRASEEAFRLLARIARHQPLLSRWYDRMPDRIEDFLCRKMIRSVLAVDPSLTPMAAVAGTIADGVSAFLSRRGMTRVVVNNGGDVAIRTGRDVSVRVGLKPDLGSDPFNDALILGDERPTWGVATSGLEGRSLTRGVASAATIVAGSAAIADAAATAVANASHVEDPTVIQRPAEELDDDTDIPGVAVTVRAGPFSEEKKNLALAQAMAKAETLIQKRRIFGAYIAVDGKVAMTDFMRRRLAEAAQPPTEKREP